MLKLDDILIIIFSTIILIANAFAMYRYKTAIVFTLGFFILFITGLSIYFYKYPKCKACQTLSCI